MAAQVVGAACIVFRVAEFGFSVFFGNRRVFPGFFSLFNIIKMANLFNSTLLSRPRSNVFNLSFDTKLSCKFGQLIPIMVQECLPGDHFRGRSQILLRFAPLLAPVMHQVDVYTHYFYVPNRILWRNWEKWITGGHEDSYSIVPPFTEWGYEEGIPLPPENGDLADYMGLPTIQAGADYGVDPNLANPRSDRAINLLPFAAYQRIWLEYYRDQNLEAEGLEREDQMLLDGYNQAHGNNHPHGTEPGSLVDWTALRYRAWPKDYFASALPWAQKGPSMVVPLGFDQDVPVYTQEDGLGGLIVTNVRQSVTGTAMPPSAAVSTDGTGTGLAAGLGPTQMSIDAFNSGFMARTSLLQGGSTTVAELRVAFRLQEWLERNARGGTRYVESILAHFGRRVKDFRLDRPEMIGSGKNIVQISEVLQTAEPTDPIEQTPLATMAGHGISAGYAGNFNYTCDEHGWIIGIMSIRPRPAYFQGMPRHYTHRKDRLDYYWPSFAHLGEQEIMKSELWYDGSQDDDPTNLDTFGYTPRYAEYRRNYSSVAGDFNSSLDFWHLARKFGGPVNLNMDFVTLNDSGYPDDLDRIFAVRDGTDYFWCQVVHDIKAHRLMPRFAIPRT